MPSETEINEAELSCTNLRVGRHLTEDRKEEEECERERNDDM